jgi:hypothetical protein
LIPFWKGYMLGAGKEPIMTMPQDREAVAAEAEEMRQAEQHLAEQQRREREERGAKTRERQAREEQDIDPNSPEGRQNAIGRGEPVQLRGKEGNQGFVEGTNPSMTSNETYRPPNNVQGGQQRNPVLSEPDVEPSAQERSAEATGQAGEVYTEPEYDGEGDPNAGVPDEDATAALSDSRGSGVPSTATDTEQGGVGSEDPDASDEGDPHGDNDQSPEAVQRRNEEAAGKPEFGPGSNG